ncbi:acyltransferase [Ferruginibacter lapsinanis]|uniref:acyltransferase family protein n=1 Tax=Ferruginibacter lapsinanis TaxID=563172 RepID=UPI001E420771|nr:acyltransferase [Ferruginibacter lapsinanis]UEG49535.1 acyltransferase [Ferruginibacter lapsinanis]
MVNFGLAPITVAKILQTNFMRIDQITFTRFLAAITIVIFHYGDTIFPFSAESIAFIFKQANVGVSYFFILSGYVMILAYGNKNKIDAASYLKNRFARIYPVYLLAIVLFLAYLICRAMTIDYTGLLLNTFVIQSWVPGKALSFNGPGWSLSTEFLFYCSFPFLFNYIYKRYGYKKTALPIILFWLLSQVLLHIVATPDINSGISPKGHDLVYYFPLMHLNEFLIGNLAGSFFMQKLRNKKIRSDIYILLCFIIFILLLKFNHVLILHNGVLAIIFIPIILLFSVNNGIITTLFNKKTFIFLGEISYGIYILQKPVYLWMRYFVKTLAGVTNESVIFYIYFVMLIIVSSLSYLFIETPLREKIKQIPIRTFFKKG